MTAKILTEQEQAIAALPDIDLVALHETLATLDITAVEAKLQECEAPFDIPVHNGWLTVVQRRGVLAHRGVATIAKRMLEARRQELLDTNILVC